MYICSLKVGWIDISSATKASTTTHHPLFRLRFRHAAIV